MCRYYSYRPKEVHMTRDLACAALLTILGFVISLGVMTHVDVKLRLDRTAIEAPEISETIAVGARLFL